MNEPISTFRFLGLNFDIGSMVAVTFAAILVFILVFTLSRNLQVRPAGKKQVALEWLADFTSGITRGVMNREDADSYSLLSFTLFIFLFVSNMIGLCLQLEGANGVTYIKSPTANPIVTLTFALVTMTIAHFAGVMKLGFKKYFSNTYLSPFKIWLPIAVFEEFANFLTLGLRIFGNIFAGEMLLTLIGGVASSHGLLGYVGMAPLELIWVGFSMFIGSIQAFVFVTLTSVYISDKIETE